MHEYRPRVYVAGAISAPDSFQFLDNIRRGIRVSADLVARGFAVFCPFLDFQFFLANTEYTITKPCIQAHSMAWLEVADAVVVVADAPWRTSEGTRKEIQRAHELGIPVLMSDWPQTRFDTFRSYCMQNRQEKTDDQ